MGGDHFAARQDDGHGARPRIKLNPLTGFLGHVVSLSLAKLVWRDAGRGAR
jgi:hypothetical protein